MSFKFGRHISIALLIALVTACGGGGGGDSPAVAPALSGTTSAQFDSQVLGTTSTAKTVSLTNSGNALLVIQGLTATGAFAMTSNGCSSSLAVGATCSILVTFTPNSVGRLTGAITVTSNASGGVFTIALDGSGIANPYVAGLFQPSGTYAQRCETPRVGTDLFTGRAFTDVQGRGSDERYWLRSWTNELYLWYNQVVDRDPALTTSTAAYFDLLKASQDRFHFTYKTTEWQALSESGVSAGYGATFLLVAGTPPRKTLVAYTEPGSPALAAGIARGAEILTVDGADAVNGTDQASLDKLNAGVFPSAVGQSHTFVIRDAGASTSRTVLLTSANVTSTPVQNTRTITTGTGLVGYMLFNDHIATSESGLINAFTTLANAGVTDLVLDLRYNGGGYVAIASQVAYMIAGSARTSGKTFELQQFNAKYPTINPVTGQTLTPMPFFSSTLGFSSLATGQALPSLNLSRVFVLTGNSTCSASEAIINSLRGIDVQVIQIGTKTCGKPYGFYPTDNCGVTYFSIQYRGVNAKNFGDYTNGFSPANATSSTGVSVPGCSVADDFSHALGDTNESRLSAALGYRVNGSCNVPASGVGMLQAQFDEDDGVLLKPEPLQNRIL
jgi:carboxyl-terminal processing protease